MSISLSPLLSATSNWKDKSVHLTVIYLDAVTPEITKRVDDYMRAALKKEAGSENAIPIVTYRICNDQGLLKWVMEEERTRKCWLACVAAFGKPEQLKETEKMLRKTKVVTEILELNRIDDEGTLPRLQASIQKRIREQLTKFL